MKIKRTRKPKRLGQFAEARGSAFLMWFESQYGKRPSPKDQDAKLQEIIDDGLQAEYTLNRCREYDAAETAALYAWQAKDVPESEIMRRMPNDQAHPTAAESDGGAGGKESNGK